MGNNAANELQTSRMGDGVTLTRSEVSLVQMDQGVYNRGTGCVKGWLSTQGLVNGSLLRDLELVLVREHLFTCVAERTGWKGWTGKASVRAPDVDGIGVTDESTNLSFSWPSCPS